MAKKRTAKVEKKEVLQPFNFPEFKKTIMAVSLKEAIKLLKKEVNE
jgi:hypothetical protein